MAGIAYLIGAGPGDPGLLTLRGKECIECADVIIYDYLADESLLQYARPDAERIYAGKQAGNHALTQTEINALLVEKVGAGKRVARLKGGDPFVFGRGGEEALALHQAGLAFAVVPGVTSAIAAPAYAGIPVTQRGMATSFAVITGHEDPTKPDSGIDWERLARGADTLTFVMGLGNLQQIAERLQRYGRSGDTPAAVVRWGTKPEQETVTATLATIADAVQQAGLKPPGLLVIGEVVALREQLRWVEDRPLFGKRIVVTRATEQAGSLGDLLREAGARPVYVPAIRMQATPNREEREHALAALGEYDYILFTSANTVAYFFKDLYRSGGDARRLAGAHIMAVGEKTAAALHAHGILADSVPATATAEGMWSVLRELPVRGKRILLPRAEEAREFLPERLRSYGAHIDVVPFYRTEPDTSQAEYLRQELAAGRVDMLTFTSSSTVRNILAMLADPARDLAGIPLAAIGEITADTLREEGFEPAVVAPKATLESLVAAIMEYWRKEEV